MNQFLALLLGVAVVVVVVVVGWAMWRRRSLRTTFGPEYDRVVSEHPNRAEAERELRERKRRHAQLDLKPLSTSDRQQFTREWRAIQARFVDEPRQAVRAADELLTAVTSKTGYPTDDEQARLADLSVEHAEGVAHYRQAHDAVLGDGHGEPTTEQLRQAMQHYRSMLDDLLGDEVIDGVTDQQASRA